MNSKRAAKIFMKYMQKSGVPCTLTDFNGCDSIEIIWEETENAPSFRTAVMFEEFAVTFYLDGFRKIDLENEEQVLKTFFAMNVLTADSPGSSWFITTEGEIICRYMIYGMAQLPNAEYAQVLLGLTEEVMNNHHKLR